MRCMSGFTGGRTDSEIMQQQSQRGHERDGGAERMAETIRTQIKAYTVADREECRHHHETTAVLTWLPRHAAWQYTCFHRRQDFPTTAYEKIRHMKDQSSHFTRRRHSRTQNVGRRKCRERQTQ